MLKFTSFLDPSRASIFSLTSSGPNSIQIINGMKSLKRPHGVNLVAIHQTEDNLFVFVQKTSESTKVTCDDVAGWFNTTLSKHNVSFKVAPHTIVPIEGEYRVVNFTCN